MDNFYTIVIFVAVVALILVLTYVGVVMTYGEGTTAYPPQSTTCPDHWVIDEDRIALFQVQTIRTREQCMKEDY